MNETPAAGDASSTTVITPPSGWQMIDIKELKDYRDLFYFLVWRDIKVLYAQTVLGFSWAILQPLIQIVIFTVVFGNVAQVPTDGIPYFLFATVAIIPWTYMSNAMTASSQSLVTEKNILGKVYFPRLIFPMTPILSKLVDFAISLLILAAVMLYYRVPLSSSVFWLPLFVAMMIMVPMGVGMWLSALAIRFRDVKFAMQFGIRMLMYSAPIVYSASALSDTARFFYSLNPLVGVIEGFRAVLLGNPVPWDYVLPGLLTAILILASGAFYFKRMERVFVDVI